MKLLYAAIVIATVLTLIDIGLSCHRIACGYQSPERRRTDIRCTTLLAVAVTGLITALVLSFRFYPSW